MREDREGREAMIDMLCYAMLGRKRHADRWKILQFTETAARDLGYKNMRRIQWMPLPMQ